MPEALHVIKSATAVADPAADGLLWGREVEIDCSDDPERPAEIGVISL